MQNSYSRIQCHLTMMTILAHFLLILSFITINNYADCRPQSALPNRSPAGTPTDPDDEVYSKNNNNDVVNNNINNNNNNNNVSGIGSRRGWRGEWRRTDPGTVYSYIWKSSDQPLGKAELYIILALLIGMATVIVGCWLSDNCWSPEPEQHYTIAWHDRHRWI